MVMQAQQPQGMSISDILSMAQMMKKPEAPKPTGDVPSQTTNTFTRESGAPTTNGTFVPPPAPKPELNQAQNVGLWDTIKGYFGG